MNRYGGTVTKAGQELIASLVAGETVVFTRVVIGSGLVGDDVDLKEMTDLVKPEVEATSSVPIVKENEITMTVEYRNDMNGGLKTGFWINEIGVFAMTEKSGEILLYYATFGNSPHPINAYRENRLEVRRYPIIIAVSLEAEVVLDYNADAFVTSADVHNLVNHTIGSFVHQFFHIGIKKPTVCPALWFDTGGIDNAEETLLALGDDESSIGAIIDDTEYSVTNAEEQDSGDDVSTVEITDA